MSHTANKVVKKRSGKKPPSGERVGWTTMRIRTHIPALIEGVRAIFQEEHNVSVPPSDVLTNALKVYKEKLRPTV